MDLQLGHATGFDEGFIVGAEERVWPRGAEARIMTAKALSRAGLTQGETAKLLEVNQSTVSRLLAKEG